METLAQIYDRFKTEGDVGSGDKGSIHSYIDVYEKLLEPFQRKVDANVMEIGLARGQSLSMWECYFADGNIIGVDKSIVFDRDPHYEEGTVLIERDATTEELPKRLRELGIYWLDVVIDDGSHVLSDQVKTFTLLKPFMFEGGIYIIEDVNAPNDVIEATFKPLHDNFELIDLTAVKGRFDDKLVVFRF